MLAWILIPMGIVIVVYSAKIERFTGSIDFAEKIFGTGRTDTFIKLFGLAVTLLSIMWVAGGLQSFLGSSFSIFFGGT